MTNPIPKRWRRGLTWVAVIVVFAFLVGRSQHQAMQLRDNVRENHRLAKSLQSGLIESCEVNGNPLRLAVRRILHKEIVSARDTPPSFLPDIPPAVFEALIRKGIRANRQILNSITPVDCALQYRGAR